mmetsp:Transcript_44421/g.87174  ORF Transcript_44421/g.87174 Transcript_44421/m.87174 type:complete len:416 (+) Transcript_44421:45-1292(+)
MASICELVCTTPSCRAPLSADGKKMGCPTCVKMELQPSFYCSQACFKSDWSRHKAVHKIAKELKARQAQNADDGVTCPPDASSEVKLSAPSWVDSYGYSFSGSLRPCRQSAKRTVPRSIKRPDYARHSDGVSESERADKANNGKIRVYSSAELEGGEGDGPPGLRHACKMGREVLDLAGRAARVGVTCDEIDRVVHEACIERDCYPSPLNYYNFPKSVCTSVNEVICHGIPDYYELADGDILDIDVTTYNRGGYHGDLNETFFVGNVDDDGRKLVRTAFDCLQGALAMVRPGTLYRDMGNTIDKIAKMNGCSVVRTYCGHGIGNLFHTAPNVPHYRKNKAKGVMKAGHVFTVEPMINLGGYADRTWLDNWTAVTSDGSRSAQFEHTVLVTDTGCEILTQRENEPVMTWDEALLQR